MENGIAVFHQHLSPRKAGAKETPEERQKEERQDTLPLFFLSF
ncbi:hypothetical protein [Ktedonobacter sp. SOSP1-52]|nr:hypothetical protein [Ktedonobacter sp. SOSP1-52]